MDFLTSLVTALLISATTIVVLLRLFHSRNVRQRSQVLSEVRIQGADKDLTIAGFLHPYCNAGGGGERVLWTSISSLQREEPHVLSVVYTGDLDSKTLQPLRKEDILSKCQDRFGIALNPDRIHFIHLKWRWFIEDATWKRFTLIGQGIGAAILALEAMWNLIPDVFLDTHGLAFSYPIVRFISSSTASGSPLPIVAYIHYPTISASMLRRVSARETTYANDSSVTGSGWKSRAKLLYYQLFCHLYTSCLLTSQPLILSVNGSWTYAHVQALLSTRITTLPPFISFFSGPISLIATIFGYNMPVPHRINQPPLADGNKMAASSPTLMDNQPKGPLIRIIYPPCDVAPLRSFDIDRRRRIIFSCAQFRPEKDHAKQIQALAILYKDHPELFDTQDEASYSPGKEKAEEARQGHDWVDIDSLANFTNDQNDAREGVKLVLLGSARHQDDLKRVEALRRLAVEHGVARYVHFRLNAPYEELLQWLSISSIGISTMIEEHFGIGVVEFMGAGLIPVVHATGGPIMDIVTHVDSKHTVITSDHGGRDCFIRRRTFRDLHIHIIYIWYHASSAEEFASQLYTALSLPPEEALAIRERARSSSRRFSTEAFENGFHELWEDVKRHLR